MSLGETMHDQLVEKRNHRSLFLFSNGFFLLLGVLSSVDLNDFLGLKVGSYIAIASSLALLLAGCCVFAYYHIRARTFNP